VSAPEGTLPPTRTASLDERRAAQRRLLVLFCGLSLGLHVGLALGWIFFPGFSTRPAVNLDEAVVKTRLVKMGKPRDEKLLPRLPTSPPPTPADKKAPPTDNTPAPDKPDPTSSKQPSAADILEKFNKQNAKPTDVRDLIRDKIGEPTDEGQLDGDKDGDALKGELQKTYFQQLIAHIRKRMEVSSTITDEERIRLKATLFIKVGADGEILDAKIQSSSGSTVFDNDVVTAAKRASPVPAPPPLVRDLVEQGVGINFCPVSCS
jgi:TonB family protein